GPSEACPILHRTTPPTRDGIKTTNTPSSPGISPHRSHASLIKTRTLPPSRPVLARKRRITSRKIVDGFHQQALRRLRRCIQRQSGVGPGFIAGAALLAVGPGD